MIILIRPIIELNRVMAGESLMCDACNKQLIDENDQQNHYKSQWHHYNLKRKIAGVQGVTEAVYLAKKSTRAEEKRELQKGPAMSYTCGLCNKKYRSSKAYDHHLKSRAHTSRVSHDYDYDQNESIPVVKPILARVVVKEEHDDDNDDDDDDNVDDDDDDPTCCFMCDKKHKTIEKCMAHMHKRHGLFIPDVEYLKDPAGLLTYLGHKVKRDFACLYCNINCHPFDSLEAVRKHMAAKSHCKVHYGDDSEEEEAEFDEFYDYDSSYITGNGKQLVTADDVSRSIKLGIGSELIITRETDNGISIKAIGSREYLRYYRQKPRPSQNAVFTAAMLAARYRTISLSTVQSSEKMVDMKVLKKMNRSGVEVMQCKLSMRSNNFMKSNLIRNQPKKITH
ncbi:cytoplasmic 60S subunit biogenesis factor REI1 homolog 1-like [Rutidosis leptorrhynchoides]|uniref:cytoplasmic 60S subunit biogenesis factor REI1 homolog 1-like n=1 Tax=Rutidosis leptorrhynchoides TaxID=125765 RepID=UPI003A98FCD7